MIIASMTAVTAGSGLPGDNSNTRGCFNRAPDLATPAIAASVARTVSQSTADVTLHSRNKIPAQARNSSAGSVCVPATSGAPLRSSDASWLLVGVDEFRYNGDAVDAGDNADAVSGLPAHGQLPELGEPPPDRPDGPQAVPRAQVAGRGRGHL